MLNFGAKRCELHAELYGNILVVQGPGQTVLRDARTRREQGDAQRDAHLPTHVNPAQEGGDSDDAGGGTRGVDAARGGAGTRRRRCECSSFCSSPGALRTHREKKLCWVQTRPLFLHKKKVKMFLTLDAHVIAHACQSFLKHVPRRDKFLCR